MSASKFLRDAYFDFSPTRLTRPLRSSTCDTGVKVTMELFDAQMLMGTAL